MLTRHLLSNNSVFKIIFINKIIKKTTIIIALFIVVSSCIATKQIIFPYRKFILLDSIDKKPLENVTLYFTSPRDTLNNRLENRHTSDNNGIITIPKLEISKGNNHTIIKPYLEVKYVFKKDGYKTVAFNFFEYFKIDTPKELKKRYKAKIYLVKK